MPGTFIQERPTTHAGFGTRELTVTGTGPTIVLVHGFAHSADTWRPVMGLLGAAGHSVVAIDLPGFGSADPLGTAELLPQLDAFLADVIGAYGDREPVVLVGNSLGAALAARAARNADLPIGVVMPIDIAGVRWTSLVSYGLGPLKILVQLTSGVRLPSHAHRAMSHRVVARLLYGQQQSIDQAMVAAVVAGIPTLATAALLVGQGAQLKGELDRVTDHGGIGIPMTVVHGLRDRLVPVAASQLIHRSNPGSRLILLRHAGHCPQLDAPHDIARHAGELARMTTNFKEIS